MSLSLAHAYLEQAKADYSSYNIVRRAPGQPSSQWLHLLQMSLEKTAKAYLAAANTDFDKLRTSHRAFLRFIRQLPRNREIRAHLDMDAQALKSHINSLAPLVHDIERLVPGRDNYGPNVEYPWQNPQDGFYSPCLYDFRNVVTVLNSTAIGRNLLRILERGLFEERWHAAFGIKPSSGNGGGGNANFS
jgi:hypothetical protein